MHPYVGGAIVGALGLVYGLIVGSPKFKASNPRLASRFTSIGAFVLLAAFIGLFLVPLVLGWGR